MQYGLIGEKLGHSFSAIIHRELSGIDYELKELRPDEVAPFMQQADFKAINVTIPYKESVIPFLAQIDEPARLIGSVNTVVNKNGALYGFNTDFDGMKLMLERAEISLKGKKILILGSGGTAKTATAVAKYECAEKIITVSRTGEVNYSNVQDLHSDAQVIINTTPVGMFPNADTAPLDLEPFKELEGVADAIYNPLRTTLTVQAGRLGVKNTNGLYMLVAQAVKAAEHFHSEAIPMAECERVFKKLLGQKRNIVLIGMPGSGKSTQGKRLAAETGKEFIDTDELVEQLSGKTPGEIIRTQGEAEFRKIESEAVALAAKYSGAVIATGGGTVLKPENVDRLRRNGFLLFLNRNLDDIMPTDDRPLSSSRERLQKRYKERLPIYKAVCDKEIHGGSIDETYSEILKAIK